MDGFINLLKPAGMTSHDAVSRLRRITGIKRIGHTGTLDPMAVGVLPLCIGSATRMTEYLDLDQKSYRCETRIGLETDTLDIWGNILREDPENAAAVTPEMVGQALACYQGELMQVPPSYSAIKVSGKKLYEYAREGKPVEVSKRRIFVTSMRLIETDLNQRRFLFDVVCSKGTYIRSFCRDLGQDLGCGAAMSFLLRKASGKFRVEDAVSFEELEQDWGKYLLPVDYPLTHFGIMQLTEEQGTWFVNGGKLDEEKVEIKQEPEPDVLLFSLYCGTRFLGIASRQDHRIVAEKVFVR